MQRFMFAATLLALAAAPALAQDNDLTPKGASPTILIAEGADEAAGQVKFQRAVTVTVPVTVQQQVIQNGQNVTISRTEYRQQTQLATTAYALKGGSFQTAGGKKLEAADAIKMLKKGTPVLVSETGGAIDPLYLRVVNPDALVFLAAPTTATTLPDVRPLPRPRPPIKRNN